MADTLVRPITPSIHSAIYPLHAKWLLPFPLADLRDDLEQPPYDACSDLPKSDDYRTLDL